MVNEGRRAYLEYSEIGEDVLKRGWGGRYSGFAQLGFARLALGFQE